MYRLIAALFLILTFASCQRKTAETAVLPEQVTMSKKVLFDKIKGGWAGQTIGCTLGVPPNWCTRRLTVW